MVATINEALRNVPRDRVRMHVCWGNYEGPHDCDIPLRKIWPVIRQMNVGGFVLPFANSRHAHEMRVLREMPLADDQVIVAGVIDVVNNFVEHPETVADRLERVAAVVGDPTRVLGGTDCGFDSSAGMGRVASDVVWAKMRSAERRRAPGQRAAIPCNKPPPHAQLACMLNSLITLDHIAVSSRMMAPCSSGVVPAGPAAQAAHFFLDLRAF